MSRWRNWSGRLQANPERLHFVRSEADAQALVRSAASAGSTLRAVGSGHSHAPLVGTHGVIADCSGLSGVVSTDQSARTARIWAGTPIFALGQALHGAGLALHNQGDIDRQSLAGAVATGTHGSGATLGSLSTAVVAARLVLASGELVECSAQQHPELFQALRLNLGAVGLIVQLELALCESYRLQEQAFTASLEEVLEQLPERTQEHRHFEFFWYPQTDQAHAKAMDQTTAVANYPLAAEGRRCAESFEVLPNHRPHPHTEMEYSVPAAQGPDCLRAIARLLRKDFPEVAWPVEYRTLAADDIWLSSAYERPTVTISVHQDVALDESAYYRACEEIFLAFSGRPHWGKVHNLDAKQLQQCHPRWLDWWSVRDAADPDGVFLNDYLRAWQPGPDQRAPG